MINKLNHVAIAVPELDAVTDFYRSVLGAEVTEVQNLWDHGVKTAFVILHNTKLELIAPLGDSSPIAGYLAKHPAGGMHHMCFEVNNIQDVVKELNEQGVRVLHEPKKGSQGRLVIFTHPKDAFGCLLEFEESA
jgi:methylmalonyl-CoA/ethylmalonyl-CoA epimerase